MAFVRSFLKNYNHLCIYKVRKQAKSTKVYMRDLQAYPYFLIYLASYKAKSRNKLVNLSCKLLHSCHVSLLAI